MFVWFTLVFYVCFWKRELRHTQYCVMRGFKSFVQKSRVIGINVSASYSWQYWLSSILKRHLKGHYLLLWKRTNWEMTIWYRHCMKSVRIQSNSGPHSPAFGLNTGRCSVPYSVRMWENAYQNNSQYGRVLRSQMLMYPQYI